MTVIAAVKHEGNIWMAADRQSTSSHVKYNMKQSKIFFVKNDRDEPVYMVGVTGSTRVHQVLEYGFTPAYMKPETDPIEHMITEFTEKARARAKATGVLEKEKDVESLDKSAALIGFAGRIFTLFSDFQIMEVQENYATAGSGGEVASGVLFACAQLDNPPLPHDQLEMAVEAAAYHTPYVGFDVDVFTQVTEIKVDVTGPESSTAIGKTTPDSSVGDRRGAKLSSDPDKPPDTSFELRKGE